MSFERSHPTWVCGLKLTLGLSSYLDCVTPYVGVWIETGGVPEGAESKEVTPYVGVWIETYHREDDGIFPGSHPTWVCGLKHLLVLVTLRKRSHTLRGCVD